MLTRELRLRLEQACRQSGRSLAEETCRRLAWSFEAELLEQIERRESPEDAPIRGAPFG
jgi:hypothetical protein